MQDEIESLNKNKTWILVDRPKDAKVVGCKWIFKRKEGILGKEPARYKARSVAKGFTQRKGIDFNEIFSPIVKHTSIRMLLSLVCRFNLELEQMDEKHHFYMEV